MRATFRADLENLPAKARRLAHPEHIHPRRSQALAALTHAAQEDALGRAGLSRMRGGD